MINEFKHEYRFLSNFWEHEITYEGIIYYSVEAAFQAQKLCKKEERVIFCDLNPSEAKKLGRKVEIRPDWENVKEKVMLDLLRIKFNSSEALKKELKATGSKTLIEGNWWHDNTWGDCFCEKCKNIYGKNLLGELLMQVRDEIMGDSVVL